MGICSRCGQKTHVEYGSDGLAYCSACSFYGMNRQCWKCRMYVPASELQQYKGQWTCPICVQDLRSGDLKEREYREERHPMQALSYSETCERCGREAEILYRWNGRNLCKSCLEEEQGSWGLVSGGPSKAAQAESIEPAIREGEVSLIERIISEVLGILGLRRKKRKTTIVAVHQPHMPIEYAKPMNEDRIEEDQKKEERKPKSEGLMKKTRKKPRKRTKKGVSFPKYTEKKEEPEKEKEDENPFRSFSEKKKKK